MREFLRAEVELKEQYGSADPGLFSDSDTRFDSVEAFRAAVEDSHRSIEERVKSREEQLEADIRARYAERYGPLEIDIPGGEPPANGTGLPTLAQLHEMSMAQMDALEEKHPGAIDRIIATANVRG